MDTLKKGLDQQKKCEETYLKAKIEYSQIYADKWTNTDWKTVLNNSKPTQKDKDEYIKTLPLYQKAYTNMKTAEIEKNYTTKLNEINFKKMEMI